MSQSTSGKQRRTAAGEPGAQRARESQPRCGLEKSLIAKLVLDKIKFAEIRNKKRET